MMNAKKAAFVLASGALLLTAHARANSVGTASDISLLDTPELQFLVGGFAEFDAINDSTQSFTEVVGDGAVKQNNINGGIAGNDGRTQFSIRNSRFDFTAVGPKINGWTDYGYMEFDLLGYDPQPPQKATQNTAASALPSSSQDSEGGFWDNPTLRVRHMYAAATNGGFKVLAGQYWGLFGFEPDYVLDTVSESPVRGDLYYRTPQLALFYTLGDNSDAVKLETAASAERPVEDASEVPSGVVALRLDVPGWTGAYAGSSSSRCKLVPASFAVSGKVSTFDLPNEDVNGQSVAATDVSKTSYLTGEAVAFTALLPVIPATSNDFMSSLVLTGEFTSGSGDAEEFSSWSGGQTAWAYTAAAGTTPAQPNLDAGFGGFYAGNAAGDDSFHLMNLESFDFAAQYQLPSDWATYFNVGYSQLYCDNLAAMNVAAVTTLNQLSNPYNLVQDGYVNCSHDWSSSFRTSLEFDRFTTDYLSKANGYAVDNRFMLSMFYLL